MAATLGGLPIVNLAVTRKALVEQAQHWLSWTLTIR
jgi:hypothetical protein